MRLIDADALKELPILNGKYDEKNANLHFICGIRFTLDCVDQMPTILPTSANWISVKDRLPEKGGEYLVCIRISDSVGHIEIVGYDSKSKRFGKIDLDYLYDNGGWVDIDYVTHWMPLPEPPKEEENG